jgi:hypothetical protein
VTEHFRIAERAMVARRPRKASRNGIVTTIKVHKDVWAIAFDLAAGDTGRLIVLSANEIVVTNQSRHPNPRREASERN